MLLQSGIFAEEVQGDLKKALSFYDRILQQYAEDRAVAANAWLRIGFCHEKLGQEKESRDAYQKIIRDYPDQREAWAIARNKLAQIRSKPKPIDPLVKYYYERLGIDITTAYSWDGNFHAYTDWTNGNLYLKNLTTGEKRQLTSIDWSQADEFAYHGRFSRDDQYIAYSYYRRPYFIELWVVSLADGKNRLVYSDPELIIFPQDWHPDGTSILCETYNFHRKPNNRLVLIETESVKLKDIFPLSVNARGMKLSPDGKYITYDEEIERERYVGIFSLQDFKTTNISANLPGISGYDAPVWSADGKLILCRDIGRYDLYAIPINEGKLAGGYSLIQSDISNALLTIKGITHHNSVKIAHSKNKQGRVRQLSNIDYSFSEEFNAPVLDSAWSVFEWKGPNVYDSPSFGRYSLTDHSGHLRYYLDSMMEWDFNQRYAPVFGGWYWIYPSLEISRPLYGDHWVLEAKVTSSLLDGANGRSFFLIILFDAWQNREKMLFMQRYKEIIPEECGLNVYVYNQGLRIDGIVDRAFPSFGVKQLTEFYRITRTDTLVQVAISQDGLEYRHIFTMTLPSDQKNLAQKLVLAGNSWFVPAGAYADWDYIRFTILE
ncbi:tetratricopeptide repeat protein [candidate division KSB1 bacterium]|nr:tetratricopeptide repeat protein [candidate division KSB1 bacterium]